MNDIFNMLFNISSDIIITSIRLTDGSYVIAEEIDIDEENGVLYVHAPVALYSDPESGSLRLREWMVFDEADDDPIPTEIALHHIISRTETVDSIRKAYLKFRLLKRQSEISNNSLPDVDNLSTKDKLSKHLDDIYRKRSGLN